MIHAPSVRHPVQIPELTGLRGIAALLVVVSHLNGVTYSVDRTLHLGEVGVMIFFALSGFLMALLYLGRPFSREAALQYIGSRFARVAPAYLFVVCAAWLITRFVDHDFVYALTDQNILRHLLFMGNVAVFWSIPPEIQFYILFVAIWFSVDALIRRKVALWAGLTLLVFAVVMINRARFPGTVVGATLHFFLCGALAGFVRSRVTVCPFPKIVLTLLQAVPLGLLGCLLAGSIDIGRASNQELYAYLPNAVGAALIVLVYSYASGWSRMSLACPALVVLGDWSFSVYLLHEPVIYWAMPLHDDASTIALVVIIALSLVATCYLLHRVVELPGNKLIRKFFGILKLKQAESIATTQ